MNIFKDYQTAISVFSGLSLALFVLSLLSIPWMVCRIPEDYFLASPRDKPGQKSIFVRVVKGFVKNFLGAGFFLAGFVLLFIPGQGLLTMLLGLIIMDFPGKKKVVERLASMKNVQTSLNWIRGKKQVQPLRFPVPNPSRQGHKNE